MTAECAAVVGSLLEWDWGDTYQVRIVSRGARLRLGPV
jgi:hypothetical protein